VARATEVGRAFGGRRRVLRRGAERRVGGFCLADVRVVRVAGRLAWVTVVCLAVVGSPTSAASGGGSGARSNPGTSRNAIRPRTTIAAARATPRHLIRTPAIPRQGTGRHDLSPRPTPAFAEITG
jgi:hypothetical protein